MFISVECYGGRRSARYDRKIHRPDMTAKYTQMQNCQGESEQNPRWTPGSDEEPLSHHAKVCRVVYVGSRYATFILRKAEDSFAAFLRRTWRGVREPVPPSFPDRFLFGFGALLRATLRLLVRALLTAY